MLYLCDMDNINSIFDASALKSYTKEEFVAEIVPLIQDILKQVFPNNIQKQKVQVLRNRICFAAPCCGDSATHHHKKRGNIILDGKYSFMYKCFNCGTYMSVHDFLKKAGVFYLATVEGDQPRVRPFGTVNAFEGKLYIQTGKVKPTSRQLAANPKAEICAFCEGAWVRVACELIEDDRVEAKKSMLDAYPNLRGMYDENDGNTQVFYMQNANATFSAFGKAPEVVEF